MSDLLPDSGLRISGLLVPFNRWQEIDSPVEGHFVEMFSAGCLRESFAQRAKGFVKGLWEHGRSRLLGRRSVWRVSRLWEEAEGAFYEGTLTDGLPGGFVDRLRRGELGASIGAEVIDADYNASPGRSQWNPKGLPERIYRRLDCVDVSLTARPTYREATAVLRSAAEHVPGTIYRTSPLPAVVAPAWALEAPTPRDHLAGPPDYLAAEPVDYLADLAVEWRL